MRDATGLTAARMACTAPIRRHTRARPWRGRDVTHGSAGCLERFDGTRDGLLGTILIRGGGHGWRGSVVSRSTRLGRRVELAGKLLDDGLHRLNVGSLARRARFRGDGRLRRGRAHGGVGPGIGPAGHRTSLSWPHRARGDKCCRGAGRQGARFQRGRHRLLQGRKDGGLGCRSKGLSGVRPDAHPIRCRARHRRRASSAPAGRNERPPSPAPRVRPHVRTIAPAPCRGLPAATLLQAKAVAPTGARAPVRAGPAGAFAQPATRQGGRDRAVAFPSVVAPSAGRSMVSAADHEMQQEQPGPDRDGRPERVCGGYPELKMEAGSESDGDQRHGAHDEQVAHAGLRGRHSIGRSDRRSNEGLGCIAHMGCRPRLICVAFQPLSPPGATQRDRA